MIFMSCCRLCIVVIALRKAVRFVMALFGKEYDSFTCVVIACTCLAGAILGGE